MKRFAQMVAMFAAVGSLPLGATPPGEPGGAGGEKKPAPNIGTLRDWYRTSKLATIRGGAWYLDALRAKGPVAVFHRHKAFVDTRLKVEFRVQPAGIGDRAIGLIFGATDGQTYHVLHIGRTRVTLYRVAPGQPRLELARRGGPMRADGTWQTARVECSGDLIRAYFGGRLLYTVRSPDLQAGLVGVYAAGSRADVRRVEFSGRPARLARPWRLR